MTETVLVHDSANDRVATITRGVAAFIEGDGPDLEEEHIRELAEDSDDAEVIHSLWDNARKEKAAKAAASAAEAEKAKADGGWRRRWGEEEARPSASKVEASLF